LDQRTMAPGLFRSRLAPAAAILYSLAGISGIPVVCYLFNQEYRTLLVNELLLSGISTGIGAWQLINITVSAISCFCPLLMALGLWSAIGGQKVFGMRILSCTAQGLLYGVNISSLLALLYLIYRVITFILFCFSRNEGIYLFYATMLPESVMIVQAWFLWKKLREFLNCAGDTTASIAYTLTSGKLDSCPIPGFTAKGFLILAIFGVILSIDQIFSVTIVYSYANDHYALVTASHPGRYLSALCLLTGAAANVCLSLFLRFYNRTYERAVYYARKQKRSA